MASRRLKVEGVNELQRQLRKMDDGTVAELKQVHLRAAQIVADYAAPRIPQRSGQLAGSIRTTGTKTGGYVRAGSRKAVPYAGPVHFGWPTRPNPAKGWRGGPIRPNPFLYDALDARREQVQDMFYKGITKVARKAGLNPQ